MHRETDQEVGVILVELELRQWGAIALHGPEDLWNAGGAAFRDFEFLEEISDAAVAVAAWDSFPFTELIEPDRAVGTEVVDHNDFFGADADLDGLPHFVSPVIDGIAEGLLDGLEGEIIKSLGLGPVGIFDHSLTQVARRHVGKQTKYLRLLCPSMHNVVQAFGFTLCRVEEMFFLGAKSAEFLGNILTGTTDVSPGMR